jgi:hypothetical protein
LIAVAVQDREKIRKKCDVVAETFDCRMRRSSCPLFWRRAYVDKQMLNKSLIRAHLFILAAATVPISTLLADGFTDKVAKAFEDDLVGLSFRYRYEFADEDDFAKDAHASTLKTRLSIAPRLNKWGFLVEVDNVSFIGNDRFNSTRNGVTDRPLVADPKGTDLNQALIKYTGFKDTEIILGRQRILRSVQRFIGGVAWRQNEQTYDSITIAHSFTDRFDADYCHIAQVRRVFGPESGVPAAELDSNINLLDASYNFGSKAKLFGYAYMMDFDDADALSNASVGARLTGTLQLQESLALSYAGEFAYQEDYGDNPVAYNANYYLLEGSLDWTAVRLKAGYEVLEGGDAPGKAFRTPLALLHAFQGWADEFVAPSTFGDPSNGVRDLYLVAMIKALKGRFTLAYHDFGSDINSDTLGTELDFEATWSFADHYSVLLSFATYNADTFSADVNKAWVMLTAVF